MRLVRREFLEVILVQVYLIFERIHYTQNNFLFEKCKRLKQFSENPHQSEWKICLVNLVSIYVFKLNEFSVKFINACHSIREMVCFSKLKVD